MSSLVYEINRLNCVNDTLQTNVDSKWQKWLQQKNEYNYRTLPRNNIRKMQCLALTTSVKGQRTNKLLKHDKTKNYQKHKRAKKMKNIVQFMTLLTT